MLQNNNSETVPVEEVAASNDVTDSELATAWEDLLEGETEKAAATDATPAVEAKAEEPAAAESGKKEVPIIPEEPTDPLERTHFGRILKAQQEEIERLKAMTREDKPEPVEEDEEYVTSANLPQYLKKQDEAQANYEREYIGDLAAIAAKMPEEEFAAIYDVMMRPEYNLRRGDKYDSKTWNPHLDVQLNWPNAKAAYYEELAKEIKPNVKGVAPKTAIGMTTTTRIEAPKKAAPQLDDAARSVLKGSGLTDEEINEAVTGKQDYFIHQRSTI